MKHLLLGLILMCSSASFAAMDERPAPHGPHNAWGTGGFNLGGFTLGAGYEYSLDPAFGVGGYIREFPKDTKRGADGLVIVGAGAGYHFFKKSWDLAFTPGFAIVSIDSASALKDDTTTFGPSLGIGLMCQLTSIWAVGFENTRYWVWFSNDYQGELRDDMSIKVRASF